MSQDKKPREFCHTISEQYRCPRCLRIDLEISKEENAKLREKLRVAEEAHEKITKVKYGLELSDYDNMEYVADYWAKQCGNYEGISREALRKIRGE